MFPIRLQENLSGVIVIKIFGREKQEAARFEKANRDFYDRQIAAINARTLFFPFTRMVGFFSNVFMIGVGGSSCCATSANPPAWPDSSHPVN